MTISKTDQERLALLEKDVGHINQGLAALNEKIDILFSKINSVGGVDFKTILYAILGTMTITSTLIGGIMFLISSQNQPLLIGQKNLESRIGESMDNLQHLRDSHIKLASDVTRLTSAVNKNEQFVDRWYNEFRVPEKDAIQDGKIDSLLNTLKLLGDKP